MAGVRIRRSGRRSGSEPLLRRAAAWRFSAGTSLLDRRTGDIAIGAEDAAVALLGPQHDSAMRTVVEVLARIGGHGFGRGLAAAWKGQGRDELHPAQIERESCRERGCQYG